MIFLDTNIIIRYLTWDEPAKAQKCQALFEKVIKGHVVLYTTNLVLNEVVWVMEKGYKISKSEVIDYLLHILNTPNIRLDDKQIIIEAAGLYELENIDFIDAYNISFMRAKGIKSIYSYDADYDSIEDIKKLLP